ncbi:ING4 [Bugula neritina]|uniref:Inhibitor of growth protein n=1 Tax=Bugula neritina TaxID=10212 RepID=A0A7J7JRX0_BUGNE|nr:ING4 [Bugula neritina]
MAAAVYLEQHLDSLEALPLELQRNFNLMCDLDKRSQDTMIEIDKQADSYLATVKNLSQSERQRRYTQISKLFERSSEYGDDKVTLAMQTYEMVDKHIRKLDNDLARNIQEPETLTPEFSGGHPSDVLDMPVDPNEPTYCICHQVSYGEMIGCDNNDCPIEWFHFPCVNLTSKPKGKWFCPRCTGERKKK